MDRQRTFHAQITRAVYDIRENVAAYPKLAVLRRKAVKPSSDVDNLMCGNGAIDEALYGIAVFTKPNENIGITEYSGL